MGEGRTDDNRGLVVTVVLPFQSSNVVTGLPRHYISDQGVKRLWLLT